MYVEFLQDGTRKKPKDYISNFLKKYKLHANTYYRDEVNKAVQAITDSSLKTAAAKVADVGSFLWM